MYRKRIAGADKTVYEAVVCWLSEDERCNILSAGKRIPQNTIDIYKKAIDRYKEILGVFYGDDRVDDLLQKITPGEIDAGLREAIKRITVYKVVAWKYEYERNSIFYISELDWDIVDKFEDWYRCLFPKAKVPARRAAVKLIQDANARLAICDNWNPANAQINRLLTRVP